VQLTKQPKLSQQDKLSHTDARILEGLALYGPRNISKLAVQLGMRDKTLRRKIDYLRSHFSLFLVGSLYHTNIGLRKVVVFAESKPGYEEFLYQCMKSNDYWLYMSQCVGTPKCLAIYGIPAGKEKEFEQFLGKVEELDHVENVKFSWSTCFQNVNATTEWFDNTAEQWIFPWDSWLEEVLASKEDLPYTLKDPAAYLQMADWIDIMILKELEKNSAIKLKEIAKQLNISLQRLKYHFENHVLKEQMFEGHQIFADHYKGLCADTCYFRFAFKNYQNFAKFAHSLLNKPFVRVTGKVYGNNQLFVQVYLPRQQLRSFIQALSRLIRNGFLETYEYVIQDMAKTERDTIPYQLFKNNEWEYDSKRILEKLQSTVEQFTGTA
jgi:DNA-binding Lrp family transcriptional regulator